MCVCVGGLDGGGLLKVGGGGFEGVNDVQTSHSVAFCLTVVISTSYKPNIHEIRLNLKEIFRHKLKIFLQCQIKVYI